MCGISGAIQFDDAFDLYENNLTRGCYSSGLLCVREHRDPLCIKTQGVFDRENLRLKYNITNSIYFLFHSRAPTNSTQTTWTESTTHPFYYKGNYVAHNGIITNINKIQKEYTEQAFNVDSEVIPYLLHMNNNSIPDVYNVLEGLLTSWVVSDTGSVMVVKAGSSLWLDEGSSSFSSTQYKGLKQIDEDGVSWVFVDKILKPYSKFNYTNPYFI